ncbi:MAG: geranyl transferase [Planctomycetaceae bacterium]|nr:MAG: geranyl transferase [Planctomycetaceae bacterium]
MAAEPYLFRLGARLARGLDGLDEGRREKHWAFFQSCQNPDGGFRGRDSESDLYYTSFGVRGLALLGGLGPDECGRVAQYLARRTDMHVSVVDLVSWLYCALMVQLHANIDVLAQAPSDWPDRLAHLLESFRTSDGGYAKTHDGASGSTYHSFLVALCYQLIGRQVPEASRLKRFIFDRQRDDGGFVEIAPMKRSGTNPTAAAVAVLQILGAVDGTLRDDVRAYLQEVRSDDGGFQANTRVPFADSLSTFTGLLTALDLELADTFEIPRLLEFLAQLEFPDGGFRGAAWDTAADVEYSFYALGILGLVRPLE